MVQGKDYFIDYNEDMHEEALAIVEVYSKKREEVFSLLKYSDGRIEIEIWQPNTSENAPHLFELSVFKTMLVDAERTLLNGVK